MANDPKLEPVAWLYERNGHVVLFQERKPDYTTPAMGFNETPLYTRLQIDAAAVRREALEEAAVVAAIAGVRPVGAGDGGTYTIGTALDAAEAIRALADQSTEREADSKLLGAPVTDWSWWIGTDESVSNDGLYDLNEMPDRQSAIEWAEGNIEPGELFHIVEARCREMIDSDERLPFATTRNHEMMLIDDAGTAISIPDQPKGGE